MRPAALLLTLLIPTAALAQSRPDLNGTWRLDPARSTSDMGSPPSRTDRIEHHGDHLVIHRSIETPAGPVTGRLEFGVDGKEYRNTIGPSKVVSTARWEGAVLVITSAVSGDQGSFKMVDRYSVSADRATLTIARTVETDEGAMNESLVLGRV